MLMMCKEKVAVCCENSQTEYNNHVEFVIVKNVVTLSYWKA